MPLIKLHNIILFLGNLLIAIKYVFDRYSIQCEPCLPDVYCPPCKTPFMEYWWSYVVIWNVGYLAWQAIRKRLKGRGHSH